MTDRNGKKKTLTGKGSGAGKTSRGKTHCHSKKCNKRTLMKNGRCESCGAKKY